MKIYHIALFATLCICALADLACSKTIDYNKGYLSGQLILDYNAYAESKINTNDYERLWSWLEQKPEIKQALSVAMYPDFSPEVLECFNSLHVKYEKQVEQYPHLAIAFSIVYGSPKAKNQDFLPDFLKWWATKNREVPSYEDSFKYYINTQSKMLYPLYKLSGPLLIYVADNDIPLQERYWALNRYKGKRLDSLSNIYGEIKWRAGARAYTRAQSRKPGAPMSLKRILADGGVCSQQAYYSSRK